MERLVALAERFNELWGDAPLPDGIERFAVSEGDHVVFRYDGRAQGEGIKANIKDVLPGIEPVVLSVLSGGLRLEGSETPFEG